MAVEITPNVGSQQVAPTVRPAAPPRQATPAIDWQAVGRWLNEAGLTSMKPQEACKLSADAINQKNPDQPPKSTALNYGHFIWRACNPRPRPQAVQPGVLGVMPQPQTPGQPATSGGATIRQNPGGGRTIIVPSGQNFTGPGVNVQGNTGNGPVVIQQR